MAAYQLQCGAVSLMAAYQLQCGAGPPTAACQCGARPPRSAALHVHRPKCLHIAAFLMKSLRCKRLSVLQGLRRRPLRRVATVATIVSYLLLLFLVSVCACFLSALLPAACFSFFWYRCVRASSVHGRHRLLSAFSAKKSCCRCVRRPQCPAAGLVVFCFVFSVRACFLSVLPPALRTPC